MADDGDRHRQSRLFTDDDGEFDADRARESPPGRGRRGDRYRRPRGSPALRRRQRIYDERNRVNDLTGKEWKYATKSVIPEGATPPAVQHDLRSEHGGQKPPRLCAELIGRFSKAGDTVLDPSRASAAPCWGASFCEHEGTGLREAIGFERTRRWIEIYETVLGRENEERRAPGEPPLAKGDMRHGDCAELIDGVPDDSVDLLLTDVPYWHMDELEQTRNERETRESKLGSFDSATGAPDASDAETDGRDATADADSETDPDDRQTKAEWLDDMAGKFDQFTDAVAPDGHVVVFIGDMYREQSYEFLSADLARAIESTAPLTLAANLIWYDPTKDLHVYGYPFSFVPRWSTQRPRLPPRGRGRKRRLSPLSSAGSERAGVVGRP